MDQPQPSSHETAIIEEAPPSGEAPSGYVAVTRHDSPTRPAGASRRLLGVVAALLAIVVAMQLYVITAVANNGSGLTQLNGAVDAVQQDLGATRQQIGEVSSRLLALEARGVTGGDATDAPSAAPAVPGGLPMFQSTQNDPAVVQAMVLGDVTGPEFYSGEVATFAPSDGTARVWMIWAHWCPYCQQELPFLKEWWTQNRANYPNTEIVTVTTSIDETRDNPLIPYLETEQFPFPVLVDENLRLAQQFGTVAYPYWVVTGADGTVVLRATGLLQPAQMEGLFIELERLASEA